GNLNNAIGVPLTLLRLNASHEMAIIEMGASHPGDITELVEIAEPDYGLITNVGKAHLLGFGSFEKVVDTKCELYHFLREHGGKVFLRHEDRLLAERAAGMVAAEYGTAPRLLVSGTLRSSSPYLSFTFTVGKEHRRVDTRLIGGYNLPNALAAAAVATYFGVAPSEVAEALAAYEPHNQRSQLVKTARNTLIVDAYNANPTSMAAALDNFFATTFPHKTLILGDMGELGADSEAEHRRIADRLREEKGAEVFLVGAEFTKVAGGLTAFPDTDALVSFLQSAAWSGRTILVKGSRFMHLEKCVEWL
ncbi:MAG: UDP-N-acetylmuramoyl-tripeptide--D-alanyl-D-alanine ligase, partial [Porphyromonadaceae bacterium]|nr:UDP-N-acetylmuramoyl-tripeptide--D-alanyl-D-alanine ligase [Porphyromonadaceae bacterium]